MAHKWACAKPSTLAVIKRRNLRNMWKYIEPWIDKRQYAFVSFSVLIGLWLFVSAIITQKVSSASDLINIDGTLSKYSFIDGNRGTKKYYIWLTQYKATFQIPADFLNYFEKNQFENFFAEGQILFIGIAKSDQNKLGNSKHRVRIYDLHNNSLSFLKSSLTIKQENNVLQYLVGPLFILAGICFYFYRHRKLRHNYH